MADTAETADIFRSFSFPVELQEAGVTPNLQAMARYALLEAAAMPFDHETRLSLALAPTDTRGFIMDVCQKHKELFKPLEL